MLSGKMCLRARPASFKTPCCIVIQVKMFGTLTNSLTYQEKLCSSSNNNLAITAKNPVIKKLFETSNFIGSCKHEALLFQGVGPLLLLFAQHFLSQHYATPKPTDDPESKYLNHLSVECSILDRACKIIGNRVLPPQA